jgi:hypothetical protein
MSTDPHIRFARVRQGEWRAFQALRLRALRVGDRYYDEDLMMLRL